VLVFLTARTREEQPSATSRPHVHLTFQDLLLAWLPLGRIHRPGAVELRSYLKTVAVHLCDVAAQGPFEDWPLHVQRKCLDMLEQQKD
jgi:hypothetical protein